MLVIWSQFFRVLFLYTLRILLDVFTNEMIKCLGFVAKQNGGKNEWV